MWDVNNLNKLIDCHQWLGLSKKEIYAVSVHVVFRQGESFRVYVLHNPRVETRLKGLTLRHTGQSSFLFPNPDSYVPPEVAERITDHR